MAGGKVSLSSGGSSLYYVPNRYFNAMRREGPSDLYQVEKREGDDGRCSGRASGSTSSRCVRSICRRGRGCCGRSIRWGTMGRGGEWLRGSMRMNRATREMPMDYRMQQQQGYMYPGYMPNRGPSAFDQGGYDPYYGN
mgnify:CR=1 FL=1